MPNDPEKKPLGLQDRVVFGIVLPWCGFGLFVLYALSTSRGGGAGYGFALLGFLMATGIVTVIGLIVSLIVITSIKWKSRATVLFAGCIVAIIAAVLLLTGSPK